MVSINSGIFSIGTNLLSNSQNNCFQIKKAEKEELVTEEAVLVVAATTPKEDEKEGIISNVVNTVGYIELLKF